jgi:hypothetical protein
MPAQTPHRNGRPSFKPTDDQRKFTRLLAAYGVPQDEIATMIGISPKTLRKHFKAELNLGSIEAKRAVLTRLYEMATSGKCVSATIFWAKTRCGFSTKSEPLFYRREKPSQSTGPILHGANS